MPSGMTPLEQRALSMVAEISRLPIDEIRPEHGLRSDLGLDSLRAMELLALLEDRLGIDLTIEEGSALQTVESLLAIVRQRGGHAV